MPERVVDLANEVSDLATDKLKAIERVADWKARSGATLHVRIYLEPGAP